MGNLQRSSQGEASSTFSHNPHLLKDSTTTISSNNGKFSSHVYHQAMPMNHQLLHYQHHYNYPRHSAHPHPAHPHPGYQRTQNWVQSNHNPSFHHQEWQKYY